MKKKTNKKTLLLGGIALVIILFVSIFTFQEPDENRQKEDILEGSIQVFSPEANEEIVFPLEIKGEAQPEWFEEGKFPVRILSEIGTVIANDIAQSSGPVQENGFIPFTATIDSFDASDWDEGTLMFLKSDPLQFSTKDQVVFPIRFPQNGGE